MPVVEQSLDIRNLIQAGDTMKTYGKWTLFGEPWRENGQAKTRAVCGGCNVEHVVRVDNLKRGISKSCSDCARRGPKSGIRAEQLMTFGGVTQSLSEWCFDHGNTVNCVRKRMIGGMDAWQAITKPTSEPGDRKGVRTLHRVIVDHTLSAGDAEETLESVSSAVGTIRQNMVHITNLALKRAQLSVVTMALAAAMPRDPVGYVADVAALVLDLRLGYALTNGDISVMELRELHARWVAHVKEETAKEARAEVQVAHVA